MSNIKFGAILPHSLFQVEPFDIEARLASIKLLDMLGFDDVWFFTNTFNPAEISAFKSAISSISQTTKNISVGLALNPSDVPDSAIEATKRLDQLEFRSAIGLAIAAQVSPASARIAGTHDIGLVSIGATAPGGFNALASHWEIYSRKAQENNHFANRSNWSLVGPMHLAETREQAISQVLHGIDSWLQPYTALGLCSDSLSGTELAEALIQNGFAVIGTPADAISQIERLVDQTGGFGTYLLPGHNWANKANTNRSYEIFADSVAPRFKTKRHPNA
jgi:alkanesulfonate monooxygenase SsuD/methylene tetrahydromethanopterin reductase-like flavin-dependent oxidoreductase (luciferase family)